MVTQMVEFIESADSFSFMNWLTVIQKSGAAHEEILWFSVRSQNLLRVSICRTACSFWAVLQGMKTSKHRDTIISPRKGAGRPHRGTRYGTHVHL